MVGLKWRETERKEGGMERKGGREREGGKEGVGWREKGREGRRGRENMRVHIMQCESVIQYVCGTYIMYGQCISILWVV